MNTLPILYQILIGFAGGIVGAMIGITVSSLCRASHDGDERARWCRLRSALRDVIINAKWAMAAYPDASDRTNIDVPMEFGDLKAIKDIFSEGSDGP